MSPGTPAPPNDRSGVLVVDDNQPLRHLVRQVIEGDPGLRWLGDAGDGVEALELAAALRPDVVLLDLVMPRTGGLEIVRPLRELLPDVVIVIFTGFPDEIAVHEALARGANAYLEKGLRPRELRQGIHDAIAAARGGAPDVA